MYVFKKKTKQKKTNKHNDNKFIIVNEESIKDSK